MVERGEERELRLHGGIHKTGTTFLQMYLRQNRQILRRNGIAAYDPKHLRPVTSHFFRRRDPTLTEEEVAKLSAMLRETVDFEGPQTTILSQENMIGTVDGFVRRGRLYPFARGVLTSFARILPRRATSVHLCLRDFPSYLSSSYVEYIRGQPFLSFEEFLAKSDLDALSWQPLVRAFGAAFPGAAVDIWTYDAFKRDRDAAVDRLLGLPLAAELEEPRAEVVRPSASARVIEEMARIAAAEGREAARDAMRALEKAHPAGPDAARFDPWTDRDRARLARRYAEDLAALGELRWVTLTA